MGEYEDKINEELTIMSGTEFIDYLPLFDPSPMEMMLIGMTEEEKLKRELAKSNYLNIHKKRNKR